jgi:hypothetical protein
LIVTFSGIISGDQKPSGFLRHRPSPGKAGFAAHQNYSGLAFLPRVVGLPDRFRIGTNARRWESTNKTFLVASLGLHETLADRPRIRSMKARLVNRQYPARAVRDIFAATRLRHRAISGFVG